MVVSVVHQRQAAFVHCRKAQCEFGRSRCIGLNTDSEYLRFHAGLYLISVIGFRQNLLYGILVTQTRPHPVAGNILIAIP